MTDPLLFFLAVVTVLATPGPTNTLLMTAGASSGVRRSLSLLLAEMSGYGISIATITAATRSIASVPGARAVLSVVAALYLCVLARKLWSRRLTLDVRVIAWQHLFATTLLNPKVLVFALVIIPVDSPAFAWYLVAFMAIVPVVGLLWIVLGATARTFVPERGLRAIPRISAGVLACFALALIASSVRHFMT